MKVRLDFGQHIVRTAARQLGATLETMRRPGGYSVELNVPVHPAPKHEVLIVEDEALIASYLEALVVSFGYEVCALAASAPEAIENAAIHMPDVVLMDIRLARGTSGIEAARQIYARQGLRCIFLSANLDDARSVPSSRSILSITGSSRLAPSRFANGGAPGVFQIGLFGGRGL